MTKLENGSTEHKDEWYCIYCEEWHLNSQSCSVYDVRTMREERYDRWFEE